MSRRDSGFTLLEVIIALVVTGVLLVIAIAVDGALARQLRSRAERVGAAATLRADGAALEREVATLGSDPGAGPDWSGGAGGIVLRADRGLWLACRAAVDTVILAAGALEAWRSRLPAAGRDSALVFLPGDSAAAAGRWRAAPLLGGPAGAVCPGGEPGLRFATALDSAAVAAIGGATVVRIVETVGFRVYGAGTTWQLGQEGLSAGSAIQPVGGPLDGAAAVTWDFLDRTGAAAAPSASEALAVTIRAMARREVAVGRGRVATATDSLRRIVPFRNLP